MSPLFMSVESAPVGIISPLTYFIDIMNFGLSENSAFGPFGILFDFGILFIFGFVFLFLAFVLHKKILEKRFGG